MKYKYESTDWTKLLPEASQWLKNIEIDHTQQIVESEHHVVPVQKKERTMDLYS